MLIGGTASDRNLKEWELFGTLCQDRTWVERRVDSVNPIDRESFEHRISLMIDVFKLKCILRKAGYGRGHRLGAIPLPLFWRERSPILDVDVTGTGNGNLAVATSDVNTRIAQDYLLHVAVKRGGFNVRSRYFCRFAQDLYNCLREGSVSPVAYVRKEAARIADRTSCDGKVKLTRVESDAVGYAEYWSSFIEAAAYEFSRALSAHLFVVYVDLGSLSDFLILKCRFHVVTSFANGDSVNSLPSVAHLLETSAFSDEFKRAHIKYGAPQGFRISHIQVLDALKLADPGGGAGALGETEDLSSAYVGVQAVGTCEKVEIHNDGNSEGVAFLRVSLLPRRSHFLAPAAVFLSLFFVLSLVGVIVHSYYWWTGEKSDWPAEKISSLVSIVATLAATRVVRVDEHDLAAQFYVRPRWFYIASLLIFFAWNVVALTPLTSYLQVVFAALITFWLCYAAVFVWLQYFAIGRELRKGVRVNGVEVG